MRIKSLLGAAALLMVAAFPALAPAQDLSRQLKIHKERLPRPSHRLVVVHPRRLAVNQKGGRRQIRVLSHKQHHEVRKSVRGVTHHLTTPHHPNRH